MYFNFIYIYIYIILSTKVSVPMNHLFFQRKQSHEKTGEGRGWQREGLHR